MGKITVKHYLNTSLKPFIIRTEKYYAVYLLITGNRKTTKVKSYEFDYQLEKDFNDFLNPKNQNYAIMEKEAKTVENMITAQMELSKKFNNRFDTLLFSAFYNLSHEIHLFNSYGLLILKDYVKNYDALFCLNSPNKEGIIFFDWFSPEHQAFAEKYIKENSIHPVQKDILKHINVALLYVFMSKIPEKDKYLNLFNIYPIPKMPKNSTPENERHFNYRFKNYQEAYNILFDAFGY